MLVLVQPTEVDPAGVKLDFSDGGLDLTLAHRSQARWLIGATLDQNGAIVFAGDYHEHFNESDCDESERTWTGQAVDFLAEVLRGQFEVESLYRGRALLRTRGFVYSPEGEREFIEEVGSLRLGWLAFWRDKRTEIARFDFGAQG
jgi:hypothetical protein